MPTINLELVLGSLHDLFREIFNGPPPGGTASILKRNDVGLLAALDGVSAEQASARLIPGRSTVAAHVHHLRFSLDLLSYWQERWQVQSVTEEEWKSLRSSLEAEAKRCMEAVRDVTREWDETALTAATASAAHAAYHFGAIRQLLGLSKGPGR